MLGFCADRLLAHRDLITSSYVTLTMYTRSWLNVSVGGPTFPWKRRGQVTIRSTLINPSACDLYLRDFERMRGLPSQNARILRRSSFGASRLNYLLICYPYYVHVSLASSAYLASAASTLGLVQSAIGLHSIVKTPLYGFNEVLLEALRDSLPRMISLEATEQSLSHRPLVEL